MRHGSDPSGSRSSIAGDHLGVGKLRVAFVVLILVFRAAGGLEELFLVVLVAVGCPALDAHLALHAGLLLQHALQLCGEQSQQAPPQVSAFAASCWPASCLP